MHVADESGVRGNGDALPVIPLIEAAAVDAVVLSS